MIKTVTPKMLVEQAGALMKSEKSFVKSDGGYIRMKDGTSISISRQRRNYVMERLKVL